MMIILHYNRVIVGMIPFHQLTCLYTPVRLQPCNCRYDPIVIKENDQPYIVGKLSGIVRKY